jgi:hypothetical protein
MATMSEIVRTAPTSCAWDTISSEVELTVLLAGLAAYASTRALLSCVMQRVGSVA